MVSGHINKGVLTGVFDAAGAFTGFEGPADVVRHQLVVSGNENVQSTNSASTAIGGATAKADSEKDKAKRTFEQLALQKAIEASNVALRDIANRYDEMAKWYRDQAKQSGVAIGEITRRMDANSAFIEKVDEVFEAYRNTGRFDREKSIDLLRNRGISVNENSSDEKLIELLQQNKWHLLRSNTELNDVREEQGKQKEDFEQRARETEQDARELRKRHDAINNNPDPDVSEEEKQRQRKELEDEYGVNVAHKAAKFEEDKQQAHEQDKSVEKALEHSQAGGVDEDFNAEFAELDSVAEPIRGQFANAVANNSVPERSDTAESNAEKQMPQLTNAPGTRIG